jgi:hypothetical protein
MTTATTTIHWSFEMAEHFGVSDGDECNRNGCGGTMVLHPVKDCSCHISPPCDQCVDNQPICNECGANPDDDLIETVSLEQQKLNDAMERGDEMRDRAKDER